MITTILWTIYLVITLFVTTLVGIGCITEIVNKTYEKTLEDTNFWWSVLAPCILWSIWYMYFLH